MAILEIATLTDGTPHYVLRTQLEGTDYKLSFRFGERRGVWVLDVSTIDGTDILLGQTITCGRDLLKRVSDPNKPPGQLWAFNVSPPAEADGGLFATPGLYDLGAGGRCRLYYTESTTAAELAAEGITTLDELAAAG